MSADSYDVPVLQHVLHPSDFIRPVKWPLHMPSRPRLSPKRPSLSFTFRKRRRRSGRNSLGCGPCSSVGVCCPKNSAQRDVSKLGISVRKVQAVHDDPVESVTGPHVSGRTQYRSYRPGYRAE